MEKKKAKKKLCLEDYMEFLSSQKQLPLTIDSLKQVFFFWIIFKITFAIFKLLHIYLFLNFVIQS